MGKPLKVLQSSTDWFVFKMLRYLAILSLCVPAIFGAYVMPSWHMQGRVTPRRPPPTPPPTAPPTIPPPPCDSCCLQSPPIDTANITFDVLEKMLGVLENAIEKDCDLNESSGDDVSEMMCDDAAMQAIPACMLQEDQDKDECLARVDDILVTKCKCRAYIKIKEDILATLNALFPTAVLPASPACDSCCAPPPSIDSDKITCSVLDKRLIVLENAIEEQECFTMDMVSIEDPTLMNIGDDLKAKLDEVTEEVTDEVCEFVAFESIPPCMMHENQDKEECLERKGKELSVGDIIQRCKCKSYAKIKDDILTTMEMLCEDERDAKNHNQMTPLDVVIWWRYLQCNANPWTCVWFWRNRINFNTWGNDPFVTAAIFSLAN